MDYAAAYSAVACVSRGGFECPFGVDCAAACSAVACARRGGFECPFYLQDLDLALVGPRVLDVENGARAIGLCEVR